MTITTITTAKCVCGHPSEKEHFIRSITHLLLILLLLLSNFIVLTFSFCRRTRFTSSSASCLTTRITRHYRILCARPEEYTSSAYLLTAKLAWIRQFKVSITPPPPHCKCTLFKLFSDATLMGNCDANSAQKTMSMQRGNWKKNGKRKKSKRWYRERAITKKRVTQVKRTFALTTFTFFSWNHQLHFCSSSRKVSVQAQK